MADIKIKSDSEIKIMAEGGKKLAKVRSELEKAVKPGVSAWEIEELANKLIKSLGAEASFKKVPGYSWATCVNVNEGVVHGIPKKEIVFKNGDLVSVDVGVYFKGFHTDTSTTVLIGKDEGKQRFLNAGKQALDRAIEQIRVGKRIYDISATIELIITGAGFTPIRALTGHGVGKQLHEEPYIPCFVPKGAASQSKSPLIQKGMVFAVEVMYTLGGFDLVTEEDGWTIATRNGKISALFEETVAVGQGGPVVLTK